VLMQCNECSLAPYIGKWAFFSPRELCVDTYVNDLLF